MRGNSRQGGKHRNKLPAYSGGDWKSYEEFLVKRGENLASFLKGMKEESEN